MKFAVPAGTWTAEVMNWETKQWEQAEANNFCIVDHQYLDKFNNCFLHVATETKAYQFSAVKLVKTAEQSPDIQKLNHYDFIENDKFKLSYTKMTDDLSGIELSLLNKETLLKEIIHVKLGVFEDYDGQDNQKSGSYIFRPKTG